MATFTQVGPTKIRAQIRRKGIKIPAETFSGKTLAAAREEAEKWARKNESEIDAGINIGVHGKTGVTMGQAVDQYIEEKRELSVTAYDVLRNIRTGLGHVMLSKITVQDIVKYIKDKKFSAVSGGIHFSYIRVVLKRAKFGWKYHVPEIILEARDSLKELELIGSSQKRSRRPTTDEIAKLVAYPHWDSIPMADIIQFAILSAMRQAEITRIDHSTFNEMEKTIVITDRKHPRKKKGNHKTVPLLDEAVTIIKKQPKNTEDGRVFPYHPKCVGQAFRRACRNLGIVDLHFHDLRHEGTTRLFEMGYTTQQVQLFTGHEDLNMLQRYTHLKAKDMPQLGQVKKVEPASVVAGSIAMDAETLKQFKMFQTMMATMKQTEVA